MADSSYTGGETITAFFDRRDEAETALARLREVGIPDSSLRLTGSDRATGGAATGAQEDKGFLESLSDLFFPDEDRHTYEEGLRRGGYLVTVTDVTATRRDETLDILEDAGAVDLDERESSWRNEGWTGYSGTAGSAGYGSSSAPGLAESQSGYGQTAGTSSEETVPVIEEELRVGKRDRSHGRVRVRSYVREQPVSEDVSLSEEHVHVERRPVDRPVGAGDEAFRERSIEAEEHAEEAVVSKEARVVEEVGIRKERDTHTETVSDTVRHTDVEVERDGEDSRSRR